MFLFRLSVARSLICSTSLRHALNLMYECIGVRPFQGLTKFMNELLGQGYCNAKLFMKVLTHAEFKSKCRPLCRIDWIVCLWLFFM